ncbi:MAG: DNA polymerase III subunit delta' C-terminal domain-containing protein [bacterium]
MAWKNIIGQTTVKNLLQRAILEDRIAHAYCFIGIEGAGKEAVAIEFAKAVNCEEQVINDGKINACGKCVSCRMMSSLQHPNVQMIYSLPAPKSMDTRKDNISDKLSDDQITEIQEQNALKAVNPYYKIQIPKATQIKIAQIREVKRGLSLAPNSGGRRFILVFHAEEMTSESANAFLKTLEEPHSNTTIIMTTSEPQLILPTILSRCQQVFFQTLPDNELEVYLMSKFDIDIAEARLAVSIGQGSYLKAVDSLDEGMKSLRNQVVDLLRTALKKRAYRVELITKLQPVLAEKDKNHIEKILLILLFWLRDAFNLINTDSARTIINIDQLNFLQRFANNFTGKDLSYSISCIEDAIKNNRRNVNQQLLLINLFVNIRKSILFSSNI